MSNMIVSKKVYLYIIMICVCFIAIKINETDIFAKSVKVNKYYSGKVNNTHSTSHVVKIPYDGKLSISLKAKGAYIKISAFKNTAPGQFFGNIYAKNKSIKTKSKTVEKGDLIHLEIYNYKNKKYGNYKVKYNLKKIKKIKYRTSDFHANLTKSKGKGKINKITINKDSIVIKGSFYKINKKGKRIKTYSRNLYTYKKSNSLNLYTCDERGNKKIAKNKQQKVLDNMRVGVELLFLVKNNTITNIYLM